MFEGLYNNQPPANSVDQSSIPEQTPLLGENVEAEEGRIAITIRDDRVWTDGDAVTAADLALQLRIEKFLGQSSGNV
jgi:ABC-type oligopeptide transport system substrate-binding subunit